MNKNEKRKLRILELLEHPEYRPMKIKEMAILFGIHKKDVVALEDTLNELMVEGKIVRTPKNKFMIQNDENIKVGKFIAHPSGFGFVEMEDMTEDIFIPASKTKGAFHNDVVSIQIFEEASSRQGAGRRKEGQVLQILKRGFTEITGVYQSSRNFGFVVPDITKIGVDIYIGKNLNLNAKDGDKVVVKLLDYGLAGEKPRGQIIEILGDANSVAVDITAIARTYELPGEFPEEVIEQARQYPVAISEEEYKNRLDLREKMIITIDGADAKDLDDAISIEKSGEFYLLGVHIADVSHYVPEYSPLDVEALKRGTSHYLVDRVIPMLPKELSNGLCSLNPMEDKLTLSCIMKINEQGKVVSHEIKESVICSKFRMTYTDVAKLLEPLKYDEKEVAELQEKYDALLPALQLFKDCASILWEARVQRGAIDFDFTESKFILDEDSGIKEIRAYDRNIATRLIEDFMLLANETVAEHFYWQGIPFLYRGHGEPKEDKITELSSFLKALDYPFRKTQKPHPKDLQNLLTQTETKPEASIIRRMVLRSMQQAKYQEFCEGHFGLALKYYSHFTSPIRRYPDLQIHRIIKEVLRGEWNRQRNEHYTKRLPNVAVKSSALERRAEEAERDVHKLLKAIYMEQFIGESFAGIISGVTQWGFFVELTNTVEGLVSIASLVDDFYEFDEKEMVIVGSRNGKRYCLGDKVEVVVSSVDKARKTVDFKLLDVHNIPREADKNFAVGNIFSQKTAKPQNSRIKDAKKKIKNNKNGKNNSHGKVAKAPKPSQSGQVQKSKKRGKKK